MKDPVPTKYHSSTSIKNLLTNRSLGSPVRNTSTSAAILLLQIALARPQTKEQRTQRSVQSSRHTTSKHCQSIWLRT
eukprot:6475469-Amphidinium_carterae.1